MKYQNPPHNGKYKLVATIKYADDIGLIIINEDGAKEYSWKGIRDLPDELKNYLLSMKGNIEKGVYDSELLDYELSEKS